MEHRRAQDWRRWMLSAILVIVVVLVVVPLLPWAATPTTFIYIVRHAEKAGNTADPPLSAAGQARAQELIRVLGDDDFDAVFVTHFTRSQQTGEPLATFKGLVAQQYQAGDTQSVVATILADHTGGRVLVVGHSNTVDDIAAALGATGLSDLAEDQFDRLLVVHRFGDVAHIDRLRYGARTP